MTDTYMLVVHPDNGPDYVAINPNPEHMEQGRGIGIVYTPLIPAAPERIAALGSILEHAGYWHWDKGEGPQGPEFAIVRAMLAEMEGGSRVIKAALKVVRDSLGQPSNYFSVETQMEHQAEIDAALAYLDTLTPSAGLAMQYSHRNGEGDAPTVEGRYWIHYVDEGFPTEILDIWRYGAKMWWLLPRFQYAAIYGPILQPGDAPQAAQQQLTSEQIATIEDVLEKACDRLQTTLFNWDEKRRYIALDAIEERNYNSTAKERDAIQDALDALAQQPPAMPQPDVPADVLHWLEIVTNAVLDRQDEYEPVVGIAASALTDWRTTLQRRPRREPNTQKEG